MKLPTVVGFSNGTFSIPKSKAYGWHICINNSTTSRPGLTTVMRHDETDCELIIVSSSNDIGEAVVIMLAVPGENPYTRVVVIGESNEGRCVALTTAVNYGLSDIQTRFEQTHGAEE